MAADLAPRRHVAQLVGGFAAIAVILTSVGLYGVLTFGISRRTREIGVRMALGARRRDVLKQVMVEGFRLAGPAVVFGLALALAMSSVVGGLLYGITPTDPLVFVLVPVVLGSVAVIAVYVPGRRATHVEPIEAFGSE